MLVVGETPTPFPRRGSAASRLQAPFERAKTLMGGFAMFVMGLTPIMTVEAMRFLRQGKSERTVMWLWTAVLAVVGAFYSADPVAA